MEVKDVLSPKQRWQTLLGAKHGASRLTLGYMDMCWPKAWGSCASVCECRGMRGGMLWQTLQLRESSVEVGGRRRNVKRKNNHVAYQAVYFFSCMEWWTQKRGRDALLIGASFGCLCYCLLPKLIFKCKKHSFSLPTSSELPTVDLALSTLMQQITFKTYSILVTSIYNRVFTSIPYTFQVQGYSIPLKKEKSL